MWNRPRLCSGPQDLRAWREQLHRSANGEGLHDAARPQVMRTFFDYRRSDCEGRELGELAADCLARSRASRALRPSSLLRRRVRGGWVVQVRAARWRWRMARL